MTADKKVAVACEPELAKYIKPALEPRGIGLLYSMHDDKTAKLSKVFAITVDSGACRHCLTCTRTCPAITYDSKGRRIIINETSCKGCGLCVEFCPAKALEQRHLSDGLMYAIIEKTLCAQISLEHEVLEHSCNSCSIHAGELLINCPKPTGLEETITIRMMCTGRVETSRILETFRGGIDGFLTVGCFLEPQPRRIQTEAAEKRFRIATTIMETLGLETQRARFEPGVMPGKQNLGDAVEAFEKELALLERRFRERDIEFLAPHKSMDSIVKDYKAYYCLECGKCTSNCPAALVNPRFSPRAVIERSLLGLENDLILDRNIWSCLTCGTCSEFCPSQVKFPEFIRTARVCCQSADNRGVCNHGGSLQEISKFMTSPALNQKRLDWVTENLGVTDRGEWLYFVGCLPYFDVMFDEIGFEGAHRIAANVVRILNKLGITPVVLDNEVCCGHDALWSGDIATFEKLAKLNLEHIRNCNARKVITSCAECYRTLKLDYPTVGPADFEVLHIVEFMSEHITSGRLKFPIPMEKRVTYHDPCRLGRHLGVYEQPRHVLTSISGIEFLEMENCKANSICCGTTLWRNCDSYSETVRMARLREASDLSVDILVTACPKCQIHFKCTQSCKPHEELRKMEVQDIVSLVSKITEAEIT